MSQLQNTGPSGFFEPSKLAGLEKMHFTARRRVEGSYTGRHLAKRLGGAGEFVDYREYTPGDDLRRLDWRVLGRTGRSYLKLYQDETDLSCTLVIDGSGSMYQGAKSAKNLTGSKLQWVQYFATALTHLIILGRDHAGLALLQQYSVDYLPPSSSFQQRGLLHDAIARIRPNGTTYLSEGLNHLMLSVKRRGVLMLFSDFLVDSPDLLAASIRKFRARGWEVIAVHVIHPDEEHLPQGAAYRFWGLEAEGVVNCQPSEIRREYEEQFANFVSETRALLIGLGCEYHRASTADSYLDVLRSFLVLRSD
jgi:uncharacterized protein (DUF58 family)